MDLVEKARKIKQEMQPADHYSASDSEQTKLSQQSNKIQTASNKGIAENSDQAQYKQNHFNDKLNTNTNNKINNNESPLFLQNETPLSNHKLPNSPKNNKMHNNQLLHEESQSSLSEPSNDSSYRNNKASAQNYSKHNDALNHKENKRDTYSSSEFLNGTNSRKPSKNTTTMQNQVSNNNDNNKNNSNYNNDNYEMYQKALSRSPSPKSRGPRDKKPFQTLSSPQLWKIDQDLAATTNNNDIQSLLIKNLNNHHHNSKNKNIPPQNVLSTSSQSVNDNEDLFLKSNRNTSNNASPHKSLNNYSNSNNNNNINAPDNNNQRTSSLVQSPSETFGTIFQPISHTHTSPHNRSLPNSVINSTGFNSVSSSRPERLYSASRLVNQRVNAVGSPKVEMEPEFTNLVKNKKEFNSRNDGAADSDGGGSENSQLSNASKLSSTSLKSAQSEFTKGANNINNNNNKKGLSNLTQSDANRFTTVATNALTTTTTTTLINNNAASNSNIFKNDVSAITSSHAAGIISEKNDGTMSDSALTNPPTTAPDNPANKKRRPSMAKALVILGLSKKSNSASNLAYGKRFGFARSEEYGVVAPELRNRTLSATASGESSGNEDKTPKPTYDFIFYLFIIK